jgi:hypothetical protein
MTLGLIAAVGVATACSTASPVDDNDASAGHADASTITPDAAASTPDANTSAPDAPVSVPDAMTSTPDAAISTPDAAPVPDAPPGTPDAGGPCDPVNQTGCGGGQKCTWNSSTSQTECAAAGGKANGASCTVFAGIDDCVAGNQCINSVCETICSTNPNSCTTGTCTIFTNTFTDNPDTGVCQPTCDPLAPNCGTGDGCYLSLTSGSAVCAPPTASATQGQPCTALNACAAGYNCMLNDTPTSMSGLDCAYYCDSTGMGGPSCGDAGGPGSSYQCCEIRSFYTNATNVPAGIGMCTDPTEWGACP